MNKTQDLRKLGKIRKILRFARIIKTSVQSFCQDEFFFQYQPNTPEKCKLIYFHKVLFHKKTRVCVKYFVNDCSCKSFFALYTQLTRGPSPRNTAKNLSETDAVPTKNLIITKTSLKPSKKQLLTKLNFCKLFFKKNFKRGGFLGFELLCFCFSIKINFFF